MGDKGGVINDKSLPCSIHKCFGSALQFFAGARTAFEFGRSEIVAVVGTQLSKGVRLLDSDQARDRMKFAQQLWCLEQFYPIDLKLADG